MDPDAFRRHGGDDNDEQRYTRMVQGDRGTTDRANAAARPIAEVPLVSSTLPCGRKISSLVLQQFAIHTLSLFVTNNPSLYTPVP